MIILDTNVLSGLMQQQPDPQVVAWLDGQSSILGTGKPEKIDVAFFTSPVHPNF